MKLREQRKLLAEVGYQLKRQGSKHELWTNGVETVPISSTVNSDHTRKAFLVKIRRAREERKRAEREQSAQLPLTTNIGSIMKATILNPPPPEHLPKPNIHMAVAKKRVFELKEQGKSTADAVTILMTAFVVVTGYGRPVSRDTLIAYVDKPYFTKKPKPQEDQKQKKPPEKKHEKQNSKGDVDEVLEHVRSVISLPFDKSKKLDIIIDLLDKIL